MINLFAAQIANGIVSGLILALVAVGMSLTNGMLGIANLIHAGIFTIGAYVGIGVFNATGSFVLAILGAVAMGALIGFILELICIRKIYNDTDTSVILTFALLWIVSESIRLLVGPSSQTTRIPDALAGSVSIGPVLITKYRLLIAGISVVIVSAYAIFMNKTNLGMIARSVLDDRRMTQLLGVKVSPILMIIYVLASAVAALAGYLGAPMYGCYPQVGMSVLILILSIVNVGGLGNLWAVIFTAPIIGVIVALITMYNSSLAYVGVFVFMIISMMIKPEGLFAKHKS